MLKVMLHTHQQHFRSGAFCLPEFVTCSDLVIFLGSCAPKYYIYNFMIGGLFYFAGTVSDLGHLDAGCLRRPSIISTGYGCPRLLCLTSSPKVNHHIRRENQKILIIKRLEKGNHIVVVFFNKKKNHLLK